MGTGGGEQHYDRPARGKPGIDLGGVGKAFGQAGLDGGGELVVASLAGQKLGALASLVDDQGWFIVDLSELIVLPDRAKHI